MCDVGHRVGRAIPTIEPPGGPFARHGRFPAYVPLAHPRHVKPVEKEGRLARTHMGDERDRRRGVGEAERLRSDREGPRLGEGVRRPWTGGNYFVSARTMTSLPSCDTILYRTPAVFVSNVTPDLLLGIDPDLTSEGDRARGC